MAFLFNKIGIYIFLNIFTLIIFESGVIHWDKGVYKGFYM